MSMFSKFNEAYYRFKLNQQFKGYAATASIGELICKQMAHPHAPNYVEMSFSSSDGEDFIVTTRRHTGKTPHQLRQEAEDKLHIACRSLVAAGFTYTEGAKSWRPPLVPSASPSSPLIDKIDKLEAQVTVLKNFAESLQFSRPSLEQERLEALRLCDEIEIIGDILCE
jgi:hypothetical protein